MNEVWVSQHEELPEETIGIHWYAGAPISQRYNRMITEKSLWEIENTFTLHARRLFPE